MQKKLCLAAALFAMTAVPAFAELQLYGNIDVELQYLNLGKIPGTDRTVSQTRLTSGGLSGSFVGLKGWRDIDPHNEVGFVLETGFMVQAGRLSSSSSNIDDQAFVYGGSHVSTNLFGRQAYVFIKNDKWGRVSVGRQYTPFSDLQEELTVEDGLGFTTENLWDVVYGLSGRADNSIRYDSPEFKGFGVSALYSNGNQYLDYTKKNRPLEKLGRMWSASAHYSNGRLYAGLAFDSAYDSQVLFGRQPRRTQSTLFGLAYDFGRVKPFVSYMRSKVTQKESFVFTRNGTLFDYSIYSVGLRIPTGERGTIIANYGQVVNKGVFDSKGSLFGVGYLYNYAKNTTLYVGTTHVKNDYKANGAGIKIDGASPNSPDLLSPSANPKDVEVGIRVRF